MDPRHARVGRAPACRPPAHALLEPVVLPAATQPTLPWVAVPAEAPEEPAVAPELRQVAGQFVQAVLETLAGQRHLLQLERWVRPEPLNLIGHLRGAGPAPVLRLRSLRVQAPSPSVLEVTAHLSQETASRALALRLQRRSGHWECTHLEIALRPGALARAG